MLPGLVLLRHQNEDVLVVALHQVLLAGELFQKLLVAGELVQLLLGDQDLFIDALLFLAHAGQFTPVLKGGPSVVAIEEGDPCE